MNIQLLRDEAVTQVVGGADINVLLTSGLVTFPGSPGDRAPDHILVGGTLGNPDDDVTYAVILVDRDIRA